MQDNRIDLNFINFEQGNLDSNETENNLAATMKKRIGHRKILNVVVV